MSNKFTQAADDARRLLQGFAAVQTVADAFEKVGMLQQAEEEARNALTTLQDLIAKAKKQQASLQTEIGVLEGETQVERDKAVLVTSAAQASAADLVAQAQASANEVTSAALAKAAETTTEAQEAVKAAEFNRDALADEVKALQAKLDKLKAQAAKLLG